jgi:hypothetical protein
MIDHCVRHAAEPGPMPGDPFPEPTAPPTPREDGPDDPLGVPQPGPDVITPGIGEPLGIPPGSPPEIPDVSPGPMVFC